MSVDDMSPYDVTDEHAAIVDANLDLLAQFMEVVVANPSMTDQIPTSATIIIVPEDDPERAMANLALADAASRAGRKVQIWSPTGQLMPHRAMSFEHLTSG